MPHRLPFYEKLFNTLPIGVLVADDDANYVDANDAACAALGLERDEIVGSNLGAIVAPGLETRVAAQWESFLETSRQAGVFESVGRDGESRRFFFEAVANFAPGLHVSFITPTADGPERTSGRDMLVICAWTKQVKRRGEWVAIEKYLKDEHDVEVTHGMSPDALKLFCGES